MKTKFIFIIFGINIILSSIKLNGQEYYVPLGYEANINAYLKGTRKSLIYDLKSKKILKKFSFVIENASKLTNDSILFYYYYKIPKVNPGISSFSPEDRFYGIYSLNTGKDSGLQYRNLKGRNNEYHFQSGEKWFKINEDRSIQEDIDYIQPESNTIIGNWIIINGKEKGRKGKDIVDINKKEKTITLFHPLSWTSFKGCKNLLMYVKRADVFIDTLGKIISPNLNMIQDEILCCSRLQHVIKSELLLCNKKFGDIKSAFKIWDDITVIKDDNYLISFMDKEGKTRKTNYSGILINKKYKKIFLKDESGWYLMKKNKKYAKMVSNQLFRSYKGRYLVIEIKNRKNLLDLENMKFLFDSDFDEILLNDKYFLYSKEGKWTQSNFDLSENYTFEADSILDYNETYLYFKKGKEYILSNLEGKIIFNSKKNEISLHNQLYRIRKKDDNHFKSFFYDSTNFKLPVTNITNVEKINNHIYIIDYRTEELYNKHKSKLMEIPNFNYKNKELIFSYDSNFRDVCYDFSGNKTKCKKDMYEIIRQQIDESSNFKDIVNQIIPIFQNIYLKYPEEKYAAKQFVLLNVAYNLSNKSLLGNLKSELLSIIAKDNINYYDLSIFIKFIDGILDSNERENTIEEFKNRDLDSVSKGKELFLYGYLSLEEIDSLVYYYIGYLYKLDNKKEQSIIYKEAAFKSATTNLENAFFKIY